MTFFPIAPLLRGGDITDPDDANDILGYLSDVIDEAAEHRYAFSAVKLYLHSVAETDVEAARTLRFRCDRASILKRFTSNLTITGGPVKISLTKVGGSAPTGLTNPVWRSDGPDTVLDSLPLEGSGAVYRMVIEAVNPGDVFTAEGFIDLGIYVDRFPTLSSLPEYIPPVYRDGDAYDDTLIDTQVESFALPEAELLASSLSTAYACCAVTFKNITSASNIALRTVRLPAFSSTRARCFVKQMTVIGVSDVNTTGDLVATLDCQGVGADWTATVSLAAARIGDATDSAAADNNDLSNGTSTDTADDAILTISTTIPDTWERVTVLIWYARAVT